MRRAAVAAATVLCVPAGAVRRGWLHRRRRYLALTTIVNLETRGYVRGGG